MGRRTEHGDRARAVGVRRPDVRAAGLGRSATGRRRLGQRRPCATARARTRKPAPPTHFVNDYLKAVAGANEPERTGRGGPCLYDRRCRWRVGQAEREWPGQRAAPDRWLEPTRPRRQRRLHRHQGERDVRDRWRVRRDQRSVGAATGGEPRIGQPRTAASSHSRLATATPGRAAIRLTDAYRPGLYMSEQALQRWFAPHPIYFWDPSHEALIPDIRYVPSVLSAIQQATWIVKWTLGDPSDWISGATQQTVNASLVDPSSISVTNDGTYVVNLSTTAHALEPLARSLTSCVGRSARRPSAARSRRRWTSKSRDSRRSCRPTTGSVNSCPIWPRRVRRSRRARTRSSRPATAPAARSFR